MPEALAALPALLAGGAGTVGGGIDLGALFGSLFGGGEAAAAAAPAVAGGLDLATIPGAAGLADAGAAGALGGAATGAAGGGLLSALGDIPAGFGGFTALAPSAAGAPLDLAGAAGAAGGVAPAVSGGAGGLGAAGAGLSAATGAAPAAIAGGGADLTSLLTAPASSAALQAGDAAATGGFAAPAASSGFDLASLIPKNPLSLAGPAVAGGGLLYDVLKGDQKPANYSQLESQAQQANQQAGQLEGYLTSGQLPAGVQSSLDAAKQSAIAAVKAQYATRGMSGSSAEQQDLAGIEEQVAGQGATIAQNLYNTGLSQAQLSDQIYSELMRTMVQQDQQMSQAVGTFAGSLALMGLGNRGGV